VHLLVDTVRALFVFRALLTVAVQRR